MHKVQRTVLIVDEAQEERVLIRRALGQDASVDYRIFEAENGAQALAYLRQQQPDCVLLTDQLPDMDGLTLLRTVVQQAMPHIYPIVMLTSNSRTTFVVEALQQGAHDFLTKASLAPELLQRVVNHVIEKAALQRELDEQREWFRLTLASISEGVIATDIEGSIIFMNPVAETMTSWTASQAQGQPLAQIFRPLDETTRQPSADPVTQVLHSQQIVSQTNHVLLAERSGRELPIDYSAAPIHDRLGNLNGVMLTLRDISERKAAEEALRASEERYLTLFETIDEGLCVLEMIFDATDQPLDYRFLEVNSAFTRFTGLEDAVGKTARQLVPNLEAHWFEIYGHVALTGEPQHFVEGSAAMGRWFEVYAFRFGKPERRLVALLFTNITERKQAEDRLRQQEELLRQIADNVPGLIGYVDAEERYRFVNATFETWFQRSRQQIVGSTVRELIGDEEHAKLSTYRQRALAGETISYETLFAYPDGVTRVVWGRYQPHRAADGTVLGFYLFMMDISERKQAEADAHLLADLAETIRLAADADALLWAVTQSVGDYLQVGRCCFIDLDVAHDHAIIHRDYCRGVPSVAREFQLSDYSPTTWGEMAAGHTLVNHDAKHDPRTAALYATVYEPPGERAYIGVPLLRNGQWQGIFSVTTPNARQWQLREIQLLETVAERTWLAAEKLRLDATLRASEAQLNTILYNIPASVYMMTTDHRYLLVNRIYEQENNISNAEIHGLSVYDRWPAEVAEILTANERQVLATKAPVEIEETVQRDGETCYYATVKAPLLDEAGEPYAIIGISTNITARKRAEAALVARETELRVITDNIPGLISYVDSEQRYRFANAAYEEFYNQPRHQLIGQPVRVALGEAVYPQVQPYIDRALQGELVKFESTLPYPSGMRTVWGTYVPDVDDHGAVHGFYALITDVSERKRAEEQLRASEARFRQLAEAMPQIVWTCQADGALTYINEQWPAYSGMSLAQTLEQGMWSAMHPEDQAVNRAQWQRALKSGQAYEAELRLRRADGEYRWHLERAVPVRNDAGAIEQWFGASVDIDDHKRAQEALAQINERFVLAEHASNGWVYDFDVQRWTVERSPGFSRILGYTPKEIRPDVAWWHSLFHPEDQYLIENRTIGARDEEEFTEVEYRVRHRDGHYVHLMDRSRNIHNAAGQSVRVVGITVDISERKAAEQELQRFNEQLDQQVKERTAELTRRLQELDQFAYITSHDLKAPLRAIDHLAHWISDDAGDLLPLASRDHLEKMRGRIMRMEKLLDDLLAYSRADRYEYKAENVDVTLLLDNIIRLVTPPQGFAVSVQTPLPMLVTQKAPLETVLRNLISNAIKHHNRSDGKVHVGVQDLGEFLEFSVRDDGPGIAPEFHERIFQVFQTLKPRDVVEGSGMGLAIVKKIVEGRNGRIAVTSTPDQGATFRFIWPKG